MFLFKKEIREAGTAYKSRQKHDKLAMLEALVPAAHLLC
jgi:hypothetical protein